MMYNKSWRVKKQNTKAEENENKDTVAIYVLWYNKVSLRNNNNLHINIVESFDMWMIFFGVLQQNKSFFYINTQQ